MRWGRWLLGSVALVVAGACGSSNGQQSAGKDAGDPGSVGGGTDDSGVEASVDSDAGATDASVAADSTALGDGNATPDVAAPDPLCDPGQTPASPAIYVDSVAGSDQGQGTRQSPFKTVGKGLSAAVGASTKDVYVAEGTYPEALTLGDAHAGITLHGAWTSAWKKDCGAGFTDATKLKPGTATAVTASYSTSHAAVTLEHLYLETVGVGGSTPNAPGQSLYAVLATGTGTALTLHGVHVVAGKGGAGTAAPQPAQASGVVACDTINDCLTGNQGSGGSPGAAAKNGSFGPNGFTAGDGAGGGSGGTGVPGVVGGAGQSGACSDSCGSCNMQCLDQTSSTHTATSGTCGCGGNGGAPGGVGHGGGAAVGVFASGSGVQVTFDTVLIEVAGGGDGALGATGGSGAAGGVGAAGAKQTCYASCKKPASCGVCAPISPSTLSGGAAGGNGGQGGSGGNGGDGAGGDAYGAVSGNGATLAGATVTYSVGAGGNGGGAAPKGKSGNTLAF